MTEPTRPILCVCGQELAVAVLRRSHYVIAASDGGEIYRARLRCPGCGVWRWWWAERAEVVELEDE